MAKYGYDRAQHVQDMARKTSRNTNHVQDMDPKQVNTKHCAGYRPPKSQTKTMFRIRAPAK